MVEMQVNVQRLSPVLVEFDVEVDVGRVTTELEKAYNQVARTAKVRGFMEAFPDMVVRLDSLAGGGTHPIFHWTWTGTNAGPGGTGRAVRLSGYEEWTLGPDGLIAESKGHYDEAEYERQVKPGAD